MDRLVAGAAPATADLPTLFRRLEAVLVLKAPALAARLRPGGDPMALHRLLADHGMAIHPDLMALYVWHDGSDPRQPVALFPLGSFPPLAEAIRDLEDLRRQVGQSHGLERFLFPTHRLTWLCPFPDGAGDGIFIDLHHEGRSPVVIDGMLEIPGATVYPSLAHLLVPVVEGWESGTIHLDAQGGIESDATWFERKRAAGIETDRTR